METCGNPGLNLVSGKPVIFGAAIMYAHNEMELGMWRYGEKRCGKDYIDQYLSLVLPREPMEQFDDRNRLYAMKYTLSHMQGWRNASQSGRQSYVEYALSSMSW